jgi:hypothetical protein
MNHQFQIEQIEDEEVEDMYYYPYPNDNILRCQNPVLIIDIRTGNHEFMVPGDYKPDEDTEYDNVVFHLLPNTTIEYKTSVNRPHIVYHLELNSDKLDKNKRPVQKYQIHVFNRSVLDTINNPTFHPNQIVPPPIPSRGKYDIYNYVSASPVIINEENLFKNKKI